MTTDADLKAAIASALRRHLARHNGPASPDARRETARQKARERLRKGPAVRWEGLTALVPSASEPGKRYHVEPDGACDCPAAEHGNPICWHREAVAILRKRGQVPRSARLTLPANVTYRRPR